MRREQTAATLCCDRDALPKIEHISYCRKEKCLGIIELVDLLKSRVLGCMSNSVTGQTSEVSIHRPWF